MARKSGPVTVCVINMKGGVGKSTIAALLARRGLVRRKLDVLAIDLDPQANLSQALMPRTYDRFLKDKRPSIVEVFKGYRPPTASRQAPSSLSPNDVIETVNEIGVNSLQLIPSRFDFSNHLIEASKPNPEALASFISQHFQHKDLIIIDCSPTESIFTRVAYHASGLVLVPVKPEYFATVGFPLLHDSLRAFRSENRGHKIRVAGIVINNGFYHGGNDGGPEKEQSLRDIRRDATKFGWHIFENQIPFSRGFPKLMRGDLSYLGNAEYFYLFGNEFFDSIGL